jgi:SAM-dependent methyltransferase
LIVNRGAKSVCDIGGGRNPQLDPSFIECNRIKYTLCDISPEELDRAPANYEKVVADIGSRDLDIQSEFDLVFSRMVAEHIKDGEQFHRNVFKMLKPGGVAFHFFPTFFCLPFLANRVLPEQLADVALNFFSPRDRQTQGKFPAFYSWCRGPIDSHRRRLESIGYQIELFQGFYGHGYFDRVPIVRKLSEKCTKHLVDHPNPWLTSYAFLLMRRPPTGT